MENIKVIKTQRTVQKRKVEIIDEIEEHTGYETSDGKVFFDKCDAQYHQEKIDYEKNLLDCPLCGKKSSLSHSELFMSEAERFVICYNCGLNNKTDKYYRSAENAVKLWNTRIK